MKTTLSAVAALLLAISASAQVIGKWDKLEGQHSGIAERRTVAVSEAVGVPNNGDLRVVERIHLTEADVLQDDLEIVAPRILTRPWRTSRIYFRQRARKYDIVEGVCLQGSFLERVDHEGNAVFIAMPLSDGNPVPVGEAEKH